MEARGRFERLSCLIVLVAALSLLPAAAARADLEFQAQWGAPKNGELVSPLAVDIDAAGNSYVTDVTTSSVQKFDPSGAFVRSFGSPGTGPGQLSLPSAVAVDPANGDVYVADFAGVDALSTVNSRIERFDAAGNFLGQFGGFGTTEGQFGFVQGIAVFSGAVFVADTGNNRIQRFDTAGQFQRMWGRDVNPGGGTGAEICTSGCKKGMFGSGDGELDGPKALDVDSVFGFVLISDTGNQRVQRWTPGLTFATKF